MKRWWSKGLLIILVLFIGLLFTLSRAVFEAQNDVEDNKIKVGVSILPEQRFVRVVGGDLVKVVTMIPPGYSPGNYAPKPGDFLGLSESPLYFSIGVPAEKNILSKIKDINSSMRIVELDDVVSKIYSERKFSTGARDPHIWLSPRRVKVMVKTIARELSKLDPEHKDLYEKNAGVYIKKLDTLNKNIKNSLSDLKKNTILVYHPSFGYFADDYGLKMIAIEKDGKEATARQMAEIVDKAREKNIRVIFYQAEISNKQLQTLANEIGGKAVKIDPLSPDYIANLEKMTESIKQMLK